jgi:hypothetical protein
MVKQVNDRQQQELKQYNAECELEDTRNNKLAQKQVDLRLIRIKR